MKKVKFGIFFLSFCLVQSVFAIDLYPECRAEIIQNYSHKHTKKLPELKNWIGSNQNVDCIKRLESHSQLTFELLMNLTNDIHAVIKNMTEIQLSTNEIEQITNSINNCQKKVEELHKLALQAASGVYSFTAPSGYKIIHSVQLNSKLPGTSGLKMYLLAPIDNKSNRKYILSFAGTKDIRDAISDLHFGSDQMADLAGLINSGSPIIEYVKNGNDLIITGHSLGGGLAQAAAAKLIKEISLKEATEKKFNNNKNNWGKIHLVSFNAFGGEKLTKYAEQNEAALLKKIDMIPEKSLKSLEKIKSDIFYKGMKSKLEEQILNQSVHYRMQYDVVSKLGTHFGELRTINTTIMDPLTSHRVDTLKNELNKEAGFKNINITNKNLGLGNWTTEFANKVFLLKEQIIIEGHNERQRQSD